MISVRTSFRDQNGSNERFVTAEFNSVDEFLEELEASLDLDGVFSIFGAGNINVMGSDSAWSINYFQYQDIYKMIRMKDWRDLLSSDSRDVVPFYYERISSRTNNISRRRKTRVNGSGLLQVQSDSSNVQKLKEFLNDPVNKDEIEEAMKDPLSVVTYGGKRYRTYEDIKSYYCSLSCFFWSIELFYGTSKLHCLFHRELGVEESMDRSVPKKNKCPIFIYRNMKLTGNKLVDKIVKAVVDKFGPFDLTLPVNEKICCFIAELLVLDIYWFRSETFCILRQSKGIIQNNVNELKLVPLIKFSGTKKIKKRMDERNGVLVMIVTDLFKQTMHAEPILDIDLVYSMFQRGANCTLYPLFTYRGSGSIDDNKSFSNSVLQKDLEQLVKPNYKLLNHTDFKTKLCNDFKMKEEIVIKNFKDFENLIGLIQNTVHLEKNTRIYFTTSCLQDCEFYEEIVQLFEPYGLMFYNRISMFDVLSIFYFMIHAKDEWFYIPNLNFVNCRLTNGNSLVRQILTRRLSNPEDCNTFLRLTGVSNFRFHKNGYFFYFSEHDDTEKNIGSFVFSDIGQKILPISDEVDQAIYNLEIESRQDEEKRKYIHEKTGVIKFYDYNTRNGALLKDIFCLQRNSFKQTHLSRLMKFRETYTPLLENIFCYDPNIIEPVTPVLYNGSLYKEFGSPSRLIEIDCSKMYTHIVQGGYKDIWCPDFYNQPLFIGGVEDPTFSKLETPVRSYYIDYGFVVIKKSKMNFTYLENLCPEYFNTMSSWWQLYNTSREILFIDSYLIIYTCEKVCQIKNITSKYDLYKKIQFDGMGIYGGYFDFTENLRNVFHRHMTLVKGTRLGSIFSSEVSGSTVNRYVVSEGNGIVKKPQYNLLCSQKKQDVLLYDEKFKSMDRVFLAFADACERMAKVFPEEEAIGIIKEQVNGFIGSSKTMSSGGCFINTTSDIMTSCESDFRLLQEQVPNNIMYWARTLNYTDHHLVCMTTGRLTFDRNSFAGFRRYVLHTCSAFMDHLNYISKPVRIATDSVLVLPKYEEDVKKEIEKFSYGNRNNLKNNIVIGHTNPFKKKEVFMRDFDMIDFLPGQGILHEQLMDSIPSFKLAPKYLKVKQGFSSYCNEDLKPDQKLEDKNNFILKHISFIENKITEFKDSEILWKAFKEKEWDFTIPAIVDNGKKLHQFLMDDKYSEVKKPLYEYHIEKSLEILSSSPMTMIGEPGAGKTYRSKKLCDYFSRERKKTIVTSSMHSVLRLYGSHVLPDGSRLPISTFHAFTKVGIHPEKYKFDPGERLSLQEDIQLYDVIFCEEVETYDSVFIGFLKSLKEKYGYLIYLVGDPLQSSPSFGRGIDMNSEAVKYLTNYNRYEFDLQFRNLNENYLEKLHLSAQGNLNLYLDKDMSTYLCDTLAAHMLDEQLDRCVKDYLSCKPTRLFSCKNYKINMVVSMEILSRMFLETEWLDKCPVYIHVGKNQYGKNGTDEHKLLEGDFFNDACDRKYRERIEKEADGRGPPSANFLVGLPLIVHTGFRFRSLGRFKTKYSENLIHKGVVYIFKGINKEKLNLKNGNRIETFLVDIFTMETEEKETVKITEFEFQMYFVYEFTIQRDFIIGETLDRLTILNPYFATNISAYKKLKDTLDECTRWYGKNSVLTKEGRMMRVAVTRVREVGTTCVLDINVYKSTFWHRFLVNDTSLNLVYKDCRVDRISDMRKIVVLGKLEVLNDKEYVSASAIITPKIKQFKVDREKIKKRHHFPNALKCNTRKRKYIF